MQRKAHLYLPAKTAMQSGTANTARWVLEFVPQDKKSVDPVMGWISSADTTRQLKMYFATQAEAQEYAKENGILVELRAAHERKLKTKSYAANFASAKRQYNDIAATNAS